MLPRAMWLLLPLGRAAAALSGPFSWLRRHGLDRLRPPLQAPQQAGGAVAVDRQHLGAGGGPEDHVGPALVGDRAGVLLAHAAGGAVAAEVGDQRPPGEVIHPSPFP